MATVTPNISELAALLAGVQAAKQAPMAIKQAAPPVATPSMAAVMPKQPFSVAALPNTVAQPTLSTFVPNAAPKPEPVMPTLAPTMGDPYRNNAVMARRTGLESNLSDANKPLNQTDYGPSIWQRIGAAMATFGAGMQHNPNAIGIGNEIINRNFTQAEYSRQQRKQGAQEELEQFDRGERQHRELQEFALNQQTRADQNARERTKMENTFDSDIQQEAGPDGKMRYYKISQSGRRVEVPEPSSVVMDRWRTKDEERRVKADEQKAKSDDRRWDSFDKRTAAMEARAGSKRTEYDDWYDAFVENNGRKPTAEEIVNRKPRGGSHPTTFKDQAAVTKYSQDWYREHQNDYNKRRSEILKTAADKDEATRQIADLDTWDQQQKAEMEDNKKQWYANVGSSAKPATSAQAKPQAQPNAPVKKAAPKKGDKKTYMGATYEFDGKQWVR